MSEQEKSEGRSATRSGGAAPGDESAVGTTIVGGQPPNKRRHSLKGVPVGVERVLYVAAEEPGFREELLRDAAAAVSARGVELRDSELAMLRAIPPAQLGATIASLDISPENVERRGFLRVVAAGAMVLAAAESCGSTADKGVRPDSPEAGVDMPAATGSRPDLPDAGPDRSAMAGADASSPPDAPADAADDLADLGLDQAMVTGIRPDDGGE